MTAAEMKEDFLILYDKITNFDAPGYEDDEISSFLSRAQERTILHIINPLGNKYQAGFELTEKRKKDLSELVSNGVLITSVSTPDNKPNGAFFDLPGNFLYAISEEATISSTDPCYDGKRILVKPITHDLYAKNIKNPFKKPYGELIWRLDYSRAAVGTNPKRHELITDTPSTVTQYHLRYIRRPVDIDITAGTDCELDEITHRQIVDEAVAIATGVTNPVSYQVRRGETQVSE